jgi:3-methylcrotonyl-CoA carboxylase beta subunit
MGGPQAASVLATITPDSDKWPAEKMDKFKKPIIDRYEQEGHPYYSSARCVVAYVECDCPSLFDVIPSL